MEVAIIRPGPIQGNAVHPYLRRRQGLEPVTYLHPSLEPVLKETLGVILYQEQVMKVAIDVAGFSAADSDGFRRAMGTWRSRKEMEKLHARFVDGCMAQAASPRSRPRSCSTRSPAFASFGFNKSHAAAFARTAYESAFLKLFYPAQFVTGLINAQPMGFYPVEVLINDAKRHGVRGAARGRQPEPLADDAPSGSACPASHCPRARHRPATGGRCARRRASFPMQRRPAARRRRPRAATASAWACTWSRASARRRASSSTRRSSATGPIASLADLVARTELSEEVVERLIRAGALDSLGRPRRELLWQLREVAVGRARPTDGRRRIEKARGRPMDLRLPPTPTPDLPPPTELERLGDSYAILSLDARRQVVELFRPALDRLGAVTNAALVGQVDPGPVAHRRAGGDPAAPDDGQGHGLPGAGGRDRHGQRHTLAQRLGASCEAWSAATRCSTWRATSRASTVVNLVAHRIRPLDRGCASAGGPARRPASATWATRDASSGLSDGRRRGTPGRFLGIPLIASTSRRGDDGAQGGNHAVATGKTAKVAWFAIG